MRWPQKLHHIYTGWNTIIWQLLIRYTHPPKKKKTQKTQLFWKGSKLTINTQTYTELNIFTKTKNVKLFRIIIYIPYMFIDIK